MKALSIHFGSQSKPVKKAPVRLIGRRLWAITKRNCSTSATKRGLLGLRGGYTFGTNKGLMKGFICPTFGTAYTNTNPADWRFYTN